MSVRIVPPHRNTSAAFLRNLFMQTETELLREIARKRSKGYVDYAEVAALERVRKTLEGMKRKSMKYVPLAIEHEFYSGKEAWNGYRNARNMLSVGQNRAVEILSDNLLGQIEEMAETAYKSTATKLLAVGRLEPDALRQSALQTATKATASGRGALRTVQEFEKAAEEQGITAFVDKAGHEWSLHTYGNMAVRTTVRQAQVASVLTTDDSQDLYKIVAIGTTCPICAAYEGRVYSKSGTSPFYPPLSDAFGKINPYGPNDLMNTFLNIHPNCLHSLVPYTEKGKTPKQIEKERRFSDPKTNPYNQDPRSKKQKAAYEEKERKRAEFRNNVKQFEKYKGAGVPGMPKNFQTFLKHKQLGDEKYKEWKEAYRKLEKPKPPAPPAPKPTTVPKLPSPPPPPPTMLTSAPAPIPLPKPTPPHKALPKPKNPKPQALPKPKPQERVVQKPVPKAPVNTIPNSTAKPPEVVKPTTPLRPDNEQKILEQFKRFSPNKIPTDAERLAQVNPHYSEGRKWQINCQRCVVANELTERGYDVTALPFADDAIKNSGVAAWKFNATRWTSDKDVRFIEKRSEFYDNLKNVFEEWGDGARVIIRVKWKNSKSAHFISAKRVGNDIIFQDPQSNRTITDFKEYLKRVSISQNVNWFMRVDNRDLSDLVTFAVKNRS